MESLNEMTRNSASQNQRAVRALVFKVDPKKTVSLAEMPGQPKDLPEDPIEALTLAGDIIEPPFDMLTLATLPEHNTELTPCLDAMTQNIDGFGFRLIPRIKVAQRHASPSKASAAVDEKAMASERVMLENFFAYAALDSSFIEFRKRLRVDMESTGNGFFEVIRSSTGRVQGFTHIPAYQMRLGRQEPDPTLVSMPILQLQPDGEVIAEKVKVWRRFRRFVQSKAIQRRNLSFVGGYQLRYFKEFGDPRQYHFETGEMLEGEKLGKVPPEELANEMVHFKLYSPRSPYGLPRYIGNLLSIMGDRAAEEINYVTFRNNNVPSMLVLVSNGQLTQDSINRLRDFVESQIQGSDNYSKFILLEAEGLMEGEEGGQVKIDVKPLTANQHLDALFQNYSKNNQEKIRCCFRLPPIFIGKSDDYTRACYSEDTQTLTERGWKYFWEIEERERIATLNPESGCLEYHTPTKEGIHLYDYDGPMLNFKNRNTDVLVTPDHWMWVKGETQSRFEKVRAQDIQYGRFRFTSSPERYAPIAEPGGLEIPEMVLHDGPNAGVRPKVQIEGGLWIEFVAAFVADGSTTPEFVKGERRCMYNVTLSAKKPRKVELFRRLYDRLKELGFNVFDPCPQADGTTSFVLADKVLWTLLREKCGRCAVEKRLPLDFQHRNRDSLALILRTLQQTDGSTDDRAGRTAWNYSTTSRELADQVQIIALHAGHRAHVIVTSGEEVRSDCYRVLITPSKTEHKVTSEQIEEIWYTGKVYCYEVPNHLFFTRRNGKVSVQGNTAEASRQLADEQIFAPEREAFDSWVNRILFPEMGVVYHKFKSNSPNTTDNAELTKILAGAERTGGMTPRIARMMLEDILGQELPEFPQVKGFDPDMPFSLLMAEAVKNQANPAEPGQQLTALKAIDQLTQADVPIFESDEDALTQKLLRLRQKLEEDWRKASGGLPEED